MPRLRYARAGGEVSYVPTLERPPLQVIDFEEPWGDWRIVCTSLMLCASSREQVEPAWRRFYHRFPDPWQAADGRRTRTIERILFSTGLQRQKAAYIWEVSVMWRVFVRLEVEHAIGGDDVLELPGCGRYVSEAYRCYALGEDVEDPWDSIVAEWQRLRSGT
jgi:adenine-specific DNA glycosylase